MKKKLTISLIIGFVSLITGLILAGIGFFSGGVAKLEDISQPELIEKTYDKISEIQITGLSKEFYIQESPDQKVHVRYYKQTNYLGPVLEVSEKDGILRLEQASEDPLQVKGILQLGGEILASRDLATYRVEIELPKGSKLNKLSGTQYGALLSLTDVAIAELDFIGNIAAENTSIEKASVQAPYLYLNKSVLKNATVHSEAGHVVMKDSSLEATKIDYYQNLEAQNLTIIGQVTFLSESNLVATNVDLSEQTLANTGLDATTSIDPKAFVESMGYYGYSGQEGEELNLKQIFKEEPYLEEAFQNIGIFTSEKYAHLTVTKQEDQEKLTVEKKDSKNKLTIQAINGTINFREKVFNP